LKQRKESHVPAPSNASIAKGTIKQTVMTVLSGKTVSTKSGIVKNSRSSTKVELH